MTQTVLCCVVVLLQVISNKQL